MKMQGLGLLVVLSGITTANAYHKSCYMHPIHYGREGTKEETERLMGKYGMYNRRCKPIHYEVVSPDGRLTCQVRLSETEKRRVEHFLAACDDQAEITDAMIERCISSNKGSLKTIGWILRDFKGNDEENIITVYHVKAALGLAE